MNGQKLYVIEDFTGNCWSTCNSCTLIVQVSLYREGDELITCMAVKGKRSQDEKVITRYKSALVRGTQKEQSHRLQFFNLTFFSCRFDAN